MISLKCDLLELCHVLLTFSVSEPSTPDPEPARPIVQMERVANPAPGSSNTLCLAACCACCCCVLVVVPSTYLLYLATALAGSIEPEQYEFAGWATVSDVPECSSVVRDVLSTDKSIGDAAVSALICMAVAAPHLMGLGGGFLALYYDE
ncbi:hypothetical protein HPB49_014624 [Dermacentor silvarum]|uniref:Uncharacterized protein n=2 Tax=Dermacentor silvarum TaxID=543639 RepID=A0ACB8CFA8_DERSI|nr:hypothetical protein HPB49_014185 [Dermacentor silvarum]KAH7941522.1 hypothetical protein HPB49_014624 [Dermacentor silvarum]